MQLTFSDWSFPSNVFCITGLVGRYRLHWFYCGMFFFLPLLWLIVSQDTVVWSSTCRLWFEEHPSRSCWLSGSPLRNQVSLQWVCCYMLFGLFSFQDSFFSLYVRCFYYDVSSIFLDLFIQCSPYFLCLHRWIPCFGSGIFFYEFLENIFFVFDLGFYSFLYSYYLYIWSFLRIPSFLDVLGLDVLRFQIFFD